MREEDKESSASEIDSEDEENISLAELKERLKTQKPIEDFDDE